MLTISQRAANLCNSTTDSVSCGQAEASTSRKTASMRGSTGQREEANLWHISRKRGSSCNYSRYTYQDGKWSFPHQRGGGGQARRADRA